MAAFTYVTGPVYQYVVFPYAPTVAQFLGTSEVAPKARLRRGYKPVFNDLGGQLMPLDRIYQGQEAQIVSALNRYDETVYSLIAAAPRNGGGVAPQLARGANGFLDIGALVNQNNCYFTYILQFPFAGTVNQPANLPAVYRFLACIPEQDDFNQLGTMERQTYLAITAQRYRDPVTGTFTTYDNTTGGVTLPAPT